MRLDKPFMLSEQSVRNVVNVLQADYSNIDVTIKPSKTSSSVYVIMRVNEVYLTTRISDHMSKSCNIVHKNILVGKSTKIKKIYNSLHHSAKDMVSFSLNRTMQSISQNK